MSVLVEEYAMSNISPNRNTRPMTTSIFDVVKQTQQQQHPPPMIPSYFNRFDYLFLFMFLKCSLNIQLRKNDSYF